MLRIARVTERSGRYYLADLAPGTWHGTVAAGLGLEGPAEAGALRAVLSGAHPTTGRQLVARAPTVCAFDLTFCAPKSVSVLYALADAERATVLEAHRAAVDQALGYVDTHALSVRRGSGDDRHVERARGSIGARFTHDVSRALDPHLHTHVVVANCTHGVDGRWSALDSRGLYAHGRAAGALYDAALRHELTTRLAVAWERRRSGAYELRAVDPVLIGVLSSRGAEIRRHLQDHAPVTERRPVPSRRAHAVAWAVTRDAKEISSAPDALRDRWKRIAHDAGWSGHLDRLAERPNAISESSPCTRIDERAFRSALDDMARSRRGEMPAVTRRDVVAAWVSSVEPGIAAAAAGDCVDVLCVQDDRVGVAETRHARRGVVAAPHVLIALGARPTTPDALGRWLRGAVEIEQYRDRWGVDSASPLGVQGTGADLAAMPVRRLADHVALTRDLAEIRRKLGDELGPEVGRGPHTLERSLGRF